MYIFKQYTAPDQRSIDAILGLRAQMHAALAYLDEVGSFRRGRSAWHDFWLATRNVRVLLRAIEVPSYGLDEAPENEIQVLCDCAGGVLTLEKANAEVIGFNLRTHMSRGDGDARFILEGTVVDPARVHRGYIAHDASNNSILMMSGVRAIASLLDRFEPQRLPLNGLSFLLH